MTPENGLVVEQTEQMRIELPSFSFPSVYVCPKAEKARFVCELMRRRRSENTTKSSFWISLFAFAWLIALLGETSGNGVMRHGVSDLIPTTLREKSSFAQLFPSNWTHLWAMFLFLENKSRQSKLTTRNFCARSEQFISRLLDKFYSQSLIP